jgi:hypothetical protein
MSIHHFLSWRGLNFTQNLSNYLFLIRKRHDYQFKRRNQSILS